MADAWNPAQYERFREQREQPFWDLLHLVRVQGARRVVDLGCGTGRLTVELHRHLHAVETLGIDSSRSMLARARELAEPGVRFEEGDIEAWRQEEPANVIFSNAALQWVDDHVGLIPRLAASLAPGGELAVQVPANFDHPSHRVAAEVASEEPFAEALGGYVREPSVLLPEQYSQLLHAAGFSEQHVRLQVYPHVLDSAADVVEWVRGTLLTDYEVRMPAIEFDAYLTRYRERLLAVVGEDRPYLYAFKRILLWGRDLSRSA